MGGSLASVLISGNGMAAIGYVLFAIFILHQQSISGVARQFQHGTMFATALISTLWACGILAYGVSGNESFVRAYFYLDVIRYAGWYTLILSVLQLHKTHNDIFRKNILLLAIPSGVLVVAGLLAQVFLPVEVEAGWYVPRLTLLQALTMPVLILFLLEQLIRNVAKDSRWNLKPLALGLAGGALFDIYLNAYGLMFGRIDLDILSVRGWVHGLMIPLMAISVARSRNWVGRIKVSRRIVIHTTMLLVVGAGLLVMAAFGYLVRFVGGDLAEALQIAAFFPMLVLLSVLIFSGSIRSKIRVWVGKHFFRYRYDYREEWLKFTGALAAQNTAAGLSEQVVHELADMVESPGGALWLRNANASAYTQHFAWNMPKLDIKVLPQSALVSFLSDTGWVVNLDEFERNRAMYKGLELPGWLSELKNAWLIIPLRVGNELIGFLVLARSRTAIDVNWEVNDLLKTAGSQAAGHLAQLLAAEALLETRKFEAFNRMSAFVVHDLKNIVAQLGLMLNNAAKHRDNPEFQQDMLDTVEHALGRMRRLMSQLQEGGVRQAVNRGVDLRNLFTRLGEAKSKLGRKLVFELEDGVLVLGDDERMERVFGHLIQNALDATASNGGEVQVTVCRSNDSAVVKVDDTGCGMTEQFVRERLFRPFQTTKTVGMGIGAYESNQYIRELGGEISVHSVVNEGTRVTVQLPLFHSADVE